MLPDVDELVVPAAHTEQRRLQALHRLAVVGAPAEPLFDHLVATAALVCGTPIAAVTLIDDDRQWILSNVGLPGVEHTPRDIAFCDYTIRDDTLLEVADAECDRRFAENPLVTGGPCIRFYAGAPIVLPGGERIGAVCVIDRTPRRLSDVQRAVLAGLGRIAAAALTERGRFVDTTRELAASEARHRAIVEDQTELISLATPDGTLTFVNAAYARHYGVPRDQLVGRNLYDFVEPAERAPLRSFLQAVCRQREALGGVNQSVAADGQSRWVAWSNRPVIQPGTTAALVIQSVGRDITEQRLAEQALARSEQRFRALYESTPACLHSIDHEGRLLAVSDRWLQLLGYTRAEVVGRKSTDFMATESAGRANAAVLPTFFRQGGCDRVDYQFVRRDGGLVDVLLSAMPERDQHGTPLRALVVLEDVTDKRRLAAELGRTHARLNAIVDNVPALLGHWNRDGVTQFANREFLAAFGQPLEALVGQPLQAVCDAADPEAWGVLAPHVAAVLRGTRQEFELAMLTTSGLRQLRMNLVPDQPQDGHVAGFYGMAHDITGRKALELRMRESELRYRSLFDHLNSGFALHEIVADSTGKPVDYRFLAMNQSFSSMTGLQPASTIGRRVTDVMPGIADDPADWIGIFGRVAQTGVAAHVEQCSASLGRWFEVVAYRPAPGQFAVISQDVTRRKQSEAQLRDALHEKETLLKEVYHRVKNNLQVVQSLLNLQHHGLAPGPARVALEESVQRVRAMALVHEKLYQSGNLAAVSLPDYAQDLLQQIDEATGASQRRIELRAELAPLQTSLDSAIPFGLLVTELISNALKHGFAGDWGGTVRVALTPRDGGALLEVCDDGSGLAAGFDLASAASMGLQLAGSLARQLGGELAAANSEHGGACFQRAADTALTGERSAAVIATGGQSTVLDTPVTPATSVLIVEDEAVVALDLKVQLESLGYRVAGIADTAAAAVESAARLRPAVVLMDIVLKGGGDGVCAAETLGGREPRVPVIFLTSFSDADTVQRAARSSAYGYLTKPFQIKEVRAGIEVAMWKSRMERQLREADRWFALTLRCVQDGVVVVGADGCIRFMNAAAEAMTGWRHEQADGRPVEQVVRFRPAEAGVAGDAAPPPSVLRALQSGRVVGVRHARRLLPRQGRAIAVDESAGPICDEQGRAVGAVLVLRDAGERLRREARLHDSERRFRSVFESAPLGMALVAADGAFLQVNPALCLLLNASPAELLGRSQAARSHADDGAHEAARLAELLAPPPAPRLAVTQFEKRYLRNHPANDGVVEPVWVLVNASVLDTADAGRCFLYQVHDLTAQRAAAEQLAALADERLHREAGDLAQRSRTTFLSRVSHEMRTPLNAVLGFAELLKLRHAGAESVVGTYSDYILHAGRHLLALVDDVLDLQSANDGTLRLQLADVSLGHELPASIRLLEAMAAEHDIRLVEAITPGLHVQVDATRLRQIVLNVGSNAVKYNTAGGSVVFRAEPTADGRVGISIEDSGIGMSVDQLAHLFEPFNRLGREALRVPGVGLGLVITRKLVEQMGGSLSVTSVPAGGTVVRIVFDRLPAAN